MRTASLRLSISPGNGVEAFQKMTVATARYIIAGVDKADQNATDRLPYPLDEAAPAGTGLVRGQALQNGPIVIAPRSSFSSSLTRLIGGVIGIALLITVALILFVMVSLFVLVLAVAALLLLYAAGRWTRASTRSRSMEKR